MSTYPRSYQWIGFIVSDHQSWYITSLT